MMRRDNPEDTCQCTGAAAGVEILYVVLVIVELCAALLSFTIAARKVD